MKRFLFLWLLAVMSIAAFAKSPVPVFITAGQSNTDGRIVNEQLPDYIQQNKYTHCFWCYNSGSYNSGGQFAQFWPRIINKNKPGRWAYDAVTYYLLDHSMGEDFYVIKESLGGTSIDPSCKSTNGMHWSAQPEYLDTVAASDNGGKSLLKALCDNIDRAIDQSLSKKSGGYEFKAILWHQGESDRHASKKYYDNLKAVIAHIRKHLVKKTGQKKYAQIPVILGGIAHKSRGWTQGVEDAQKRLQAEDKNIHLVEVPDASLQKDIMHFDAAGAELLGRKVYDKLVELKLAGKAAKPSSELMAMQVSQAASQQVSTSKQSANIPTITGGPIERTKLNFNGGWLLKVGDFSGAERANYLDAGWQRVTLPRAFNEKEAFRVSIENLTDTIMWYRKHFNIEAVGDRKYFIEFEGVRFGADIWLNGQKVGYTENGVMASGFDLTPYIIKGENVIAVRIDNSWRYRERGTRSGFQWNDKNFNANYGGIPKNVFLHVTDKLYQTLPLYNGLKTTGTYIYGTDYNIAGKTVTVNAESQVKNDDSKARSFRFFAKVLDADGKEVGHFDGERYTLQPGETKTVKVSGKLTGAHFWSWGYGYLYTVKTLLKADDGKKIDDVVIRTGFRKTQFGKGKVYLNDRAIMMHGYAQRTSNEWPGVGLSVPAWMSDYSNQLMVESGGNLVRWMHVTPWKQDVESCDRVGLIQAMPAGDAERDVDGRRWEQRLELMRDAIIYNRNNPSILFYESGNSKVSREHMLQMKAIRDEFDPHGGRASGSREMLNINEAEYGGEMLYINKSNKHPMWSMEYHRDEGLRKYWDEQSYPYHKEGDGPLYRGKPAIEYNHNMDVFAASMVERWFDYWQERPGTGKRVSCGGTKIVFSDTNTHHRGEANYRTSGVTDAMRIPKDAFYAHQVMWNGWISPEKDATYIVGHWNYKPGTVKTAEYVVSTGDEVELFVNGKSLGKGERSNQWLFTWKNVKFEEGKVEAVAYTNGKETSRYAIETAGEPDHLKLTSIQNPEGFKADGADMAIVQVEVVDKQGRRCPLDNRTIHFSCQGNAEWIGGIATPNEEKRKELEAKKQNLVVDKNETAEQKAARKANNILDSTDSENTFDNYIGAADLPVECGVNRVLIRSTEKAGDIKIVAQADDIKAPATLSLQTQSVDAQHYLPQMTLKGNLSRGETPSTPSFKDIKTTIEIAGVVAGSNQAKAANSYDDDETTEWMSDGNPENAWITYQFAKPEAVNEITVKLTGWRDKLYPLEVYAGDKKVWANYTYPSLGYVHIKIDSPVKAKELTIKMVGDAKNKTHVGDTRELAGGKASNLDFVGIKKGKPVLRIVELDLLKDK